MGLDRVTQCEHAQFVITATPYGGFNDGPAKVVQTFCWAALFIQEQSVTLESQSVDSLGIERANSESI